MLPSSTIRDFLSTSSGKESSSPFLSCIWYGVSLDLGRPISNCLRWRYEARTKRSRQSTALGRVEKTHGRHRQRVEAVS